MSGIELYKDSMQKARKAIIDDLSQREFIVFVGAGISEPTGIPLWKELLKALYEEQPIDGVEIDHVKEHQYPNIAQMLFDEFAKQGNTNAYKEIIQRTMQSTKIPHTVTQEEIILASGGKIVTTNFDDTFESAFETLNRRGVVQSGFKVQTLSKLEYKKVSEENHITYLHGKCDEDEIIFKTADYLKHYPSLDSGQESSLEKLLSFLYVACNLTVVFVGFSFEDRFIMRTLERIYRETEIDRPNIFDNITHYALLENKISKNEDPSRTEVAELLREMELTQQNLEVININVLRYEHKMHKEITELFTNINQIREKQKALTEPKDEASS